MTEAAPVNVFVRYRRQANKMAGMIEAAAALDGRMKARGRKDFCQVTPAAGPDENPLFRLITGGEGCRLAETTGYLYRRAWSMRLCGRGAVGIGIRNGPAPAERVFNTTCKDRVCPTCNARHSAAFCPALRQLIAGQLNSGRRLCFVTFTVKHSKADSLWSTRNALDRSWARLIRRKLFRDLFDERLRVAEVEFTIAGGWHTHFHCLLRLKDQGCITLGRGKSRRTWRIDRIPRSKLEGMLRDCWTACTSAVGRPSHQVDVRELTVHARGADGLPSLIRYWVRPDETPAMQKQEAAGAVKLWTPKRHKGSKRHVWRILTVADMADELSKYVTKRKADGKKTNQIPVWQWPAKRFHEYLFGIRGWNLRRCSKGWEQLVLEARESEVLAREIEESEAGGFEFRSWASLAATFKAAANRQLSPEQRRQFESDCPRILNALFDNGADLAAAVLTPYAQSALGEAGTPRPPLHVMPWQRQEKHADDLAGLCEKAKWRPGLTRRHFRILLRLSRRQNQGHLSSTIAGLGMSRRMIAEAVEKLQLLGMIEPDPATTNVASGRRRQRAVRWQLTATSFVLLRDLPGQQSRRATARRTKRPRELFATDQGGLTCQHLPN